MFPSQPLSKPQHPYREGMTGSPLVPVRLHEDGSDTSRTLVSSATSLRVASIAGGSAPPGRLVEGAAQEAVAEQDIPQGSAWQRGSTAHRH